MHQQPEEQLQLPQLQPPPLLRLLLLPQLQLSLQPPLLQLQLQQHVQETYSKLQLLQLKEEEQEEQEQLVQLEEEVAFQE